jgi:murein DD-endopeptidase MepM/ murein hydrolase activator NlpD
MRGPLCSGAVRREVCETSDIRVGQLGKEEGVNIHRERWYALPRSASQRRSGRYLILALFVVVITGGYGVTALQDDSDMPSDVAPPAVHGLATMPDMPMPVSPLSVTGTVARGETSYALLQGAGVSAVEVTALREAIRDVYDMRQLRAGQPYSLEMAPEGQLLRFTYEIDTQHILEVERQEQTFVGRLTPITYEHKERVVHATIRASLYEALVAQGEDVRLAADLAEIFACDVDFYTDLHRGDTFRVVLEDRYRDGKRVGYRRILAAELSNQAHVFQAVYYPREGDTGTYYRPDGRSMRRMFLRSPLQYTRISSQFSPRRFHPILKRYRPHLGIDYAAPMGTPVRSVGDGVVTWIGSKGGNGKMVVIQHNHAYSTYYLHLLRFANDMQVDDRVTQGQIIGYVGSTGLSTGPHLDFRMTKNGRFLNPLGHNNVEAQPLPRAVLPVFRAYAKRLLVALNTATGRE